MRFAVSDEQAALAKGVREALSKLCPPARVRAAWGSGGLDRELWRGLAELGLFGILLPEADGGLGLGFVEAVLALEEVGRFAAPGPVAETLAVAAPGLANGPWAARISAGDAVIAAADPFSYGIPWAGEADACYLPRGSAYVLSVRAEHEPTPLASVDGARHRARISSLGDARGAVADAAFERGALAAAAQLIGLGRAMIERTVAYAQVREQFGQPIGSFQAVKHLLADAWLALEFARPAVLAAAWAVDAADSTNVSRDVSRSVSLAKATASDAAWQAAKTALQVHGAIAYTTEYDLHLWMKRAWALAAAWGDAAWHRARIADLNLGET